MSDLLLHPRTKSQLEQFLATPTHGLLLVGKAGAGKTTLAMAVAKNLLGSDPDRQPYFLHVRPVNGSIGIDLVRQITDFVAKKTAGQGVIRRVILVEDAHSMTTEAQNALLKTLEEPPADTVLVLTAHTLELLRPTIRSRLSSITVLPSSLAAVKRYFAKDYDEATIESAYHMSEGLVGLLAGLMATSTEHELVQAISLAKQLLGTTPYERLVEVDRLSKDKALVQSLLQAFQRIAASGLRQAAAANNKAQLKQFMRLASEVAHSQEAHSTNANAKLFLTHMFLNI